MAGSNDVLFPDAKAVAPRLAGGALHGTRLLLGILLLLIAVAAIFGIVFTAAHGQTDAAIIIGIFSMAFFSRVLC